MDLLATIDFFFMLGYIAELCLCQNRHFRAALKRLIKSDLENVNQTEDCTGGALNMIT